MFAKNEAKRAKEKLFYPFSFFLSIFSFFLFVFCFLPRLFLPYVAFPRMSRERDSHLTTVLHRGGGTQLYGLVRVSWKDRSHPLLRLLGFGLLLLPTNFFFPYFLFFFFFPRKNLVRKCPSVVVKSNPDLISVPPIHSRPFRIREENNEENIYIFAFYFIIDIFFVQYLFR